MKDKDNNKSRWLHIRLTPEQHRQIHEQCRKTTCKKASEYVRRKILDKPVVVLQRNQSMDDVLTELSKLICELNAIGNNYNQAVKKLHTLSRLPEFRSWFVSYEKGRLKMLETIEKIKEKTDQIADKWLQ